LLGGGGGGKIPNSSKRRFNGGDFFLSHCVVKEREFPRFLDGEGISGEKRYIFFLLFV